MSSLGDKAIRALAQLRALGIDTPDFKLLMQMCNTKKENSFRVLLGRKEVKNKLIEYPQRGKVTLTPLGIAQAPVIAPPETLAELHAEIKKLFKIGGVAAKAFDFLAANRGPQKIQTIAKHCGYDDDSKMGSFKVMFGKMTRPNVAVKVGTDAYELAEMCYFQQLDF